MPMVRRSEWKDMMFQKVLLQELGFGGLVVYFNLGGILGW